MTLPDCSSNLWSLILLQLVDNTCTNAKLWSYLDHVAVQIIYTITSAAAAVQLLDIPQEPRSFAA